MKSLYTVNKKIKEIEDYERTNPCKQSTMFESSTTITYNQLKEIKKDLEVLKIIKNKRVDVGYILALVTQHTDNFYVLEKYNGILSIPYQLTMEELLKIKQWRIRNDFRRFIKTLCVTSQVKEEQE